MDNVVDPEDGKKRGILAMAGITVLLFLFMLPVAIVSTKSRNVKMFK